MRRMCALQALVAGDGGSQPKPDRLMQQHISRPTVLSLLLGHGFAMNCVTCKTIACWANHFADCACFVADLVRRRRLSFYCW